MEAESGTESQVDAEAERDALRARLTEAEQLLAEIPSLRAAREELETIRRTRSWRATAPFRRLGTTATREVLPTMRMAFKRRLGGLARRARGAYRALGRD